MTGSRVKRFAGALALAVLSTPAWAQWTSDKPPVLTPDDYPPVADEDNDKPDQQTANSAPRPLQQQAPGGATAAPLPAQPATMAAVAPDVEVGTLGVAEGPPVGTLNASNGGFGDNLWSGSERARVEELLTRAPLASADPQLRTAVKRLVLTKAPSPLGRAKRAFVTMRIEKLLDAGLIDEAGTIAAQASIANDADFARVQANALLTANRAADVCGDDTAQRLNSDELFWMQLRAYCAAVAGDAAAADLTLEVIKARGAGDAAFAARVRDIATRGATPPPAVAHPTAMHVFLFQRAGLPIPESVARTMGTAANLLAMRDGRNPPRARFEAAERIIRTGAAPLTELKVIADAQDLPLARVATAAADAPNLPFFMGQVLLRRAAVIEPRPEEKARLAAEALSLGDKAGMFGLAAALQSDVLGSLAPAPSPDARLFARALLLIGRTDQAARWAMNDPAMLAAIGAMSQDPARAAAAQTSMSAFAAGLAKNPPDPDPDRATKAVLLGLCDVLGLPMLPDAKAEAAAVEAQSWDGKRPDAGTMRAIEEASSRPDRRGEALLAILATLHEQGLRDLAPDATIELVRLLVAMNEAKLAHGLAVEALALYQPPPLPAAAAAAK